MNGTGEDDDPTPKSPDCGVKSSKKVRAPELRVTYGTCENEILEDMVTQNIQPNVTFCMVSYSWLLVFSLTSFRIR